MSFHIRRPLAPIGLAVFALCIGSANAGGAATLQRLAVALDIGPMAASVVAGSGASTIIEEMMRAVPTRTVLPDAIELRGATTEVRIGLAHEADMDIQVTNESGAIVCSARVHMPAGWQKVAFSGRDRDGHLLPNGVYLYRILVEDDILVTRAIIDR